MLNFSSYILYLLLLTVCYSAFGFTLDINISMCYVTFTLPSLTSYTLYLLLLTIRQFAFGFTLDINKKIYTKLSVILSGCFEGCKFSSFLLLFSFSFIAGWKPVIQIFSTNYARFFCLFL